MQKKNWIHKYCGSYDTTGAVNLELLNENLRNVSGLTYKGDPLSEENKIEELPTDVKVDNFDFKISGTGDVDEDVIAPGNSGGEYSPGMTKDELDEYLKEIAKTVKKETKDEMQSEINEKANNVKKETKNEMYPIGSIYISTEISTAEEVGNLLGGTWVAYAQGRTLVGSGTSDRAFTAGETGGESTHTLTTTEIPSHTHTLTATKVSTSAVADHAHTISLTSGGSGTLTTSAAGKHRHAPGASTTANFLAVLSSAVGRRTVGSSGTNRGYAVTTDSTTDASAISWPAYTAYAGEHTHTIASHTHTVSGSTGAAGGHSHTVSGTSDASGGSGAHNNLQPYVVTYIYKRTE